MKKIIIYIVLLFVAFTNIFASCEEELEKEAKRKKNSKVYFEEQRIYSNVDSSYTEISAFVGKLKNGHKYVYHLYTSKNKSQMEVEHLVKECDKCNNNK